MVAFKIKKIHTAAHTRLFFCCRMAALFHVLVRQRIGSLLVMHCRAATSSISVNVYWHHHQAYEPKQFLLDVQFKWFAMQTFGCFVVVGQLISLIRNCQVAIEDNSMMRYVHLAHTMYHTTMATTSQTTCINSIFRLFIVQSLIHWNILDAKLFKARNRTRKQPNSHDSGVNMSSKKCKIRLPTPQLCAPTSNDNFVWFCSPKFLEVFESIFGARFSKNARYVVQKYHRRHF